MKAFAWTIAVALALAAGCGKRESPKDAQAARRVVSLSPSTTETLFAIGAGSQTVGRSRYCDYPKEALALPQVGGYVDPNVEAILALRPTLVVGARGPAGPKVAEAFSVHGVATYFPETESIPQIEGMILGLGARTGHEPEAQKLVDQMRAELGAIAARNAAIPNKRVLLVFGLEPVVVAGPKSFPDEMLRAAGGSNVVTEGSSYPTLGLERILVLDPDVVIDASMAESAGDERIRPDTPGWSKLRAVRDKHVVRIADETVLRPGPRVARGVEALSKAIGAP